METIGLIKEDGSIELGYGEQGFIYKDFEAFENKSDKICYIPETGTDDLQNPTLENSTAYTYKDFLELAQGFYTEDSEVREWCDKNKVTPHTIAKELFYSVDWQHPETLLDEWKNHGAYTE